ncbi:hypothetical protein PFISCL1PPCAC_12356, partial [Pristionchus fissidentatus]
RVVAREKCSSSSPLRCLSPRSSHSVAAARRRSRLPSHRPHPARLPCLESPRPQEELPRHRPKRLLLTEHHRLARPEQLEVHEERSKIR